MFAMGGSEGLSGAKRHEVVEAVTDCFFAFLTEGSGVA